MGVREGRGRGGAGGVGLFDATAFTKHRVEGPGATAFLDWLTCNRLPKEGRINLTYALTEAGTVRTEFTIVRLGPDSYYLVSSGGATDYDGDFLRKQAEAKRAEFGWLSVQDVTTQYGVFAVAGPKSRELLRPLVVDADPAPRCRTGGSRGSRCASSISGCARPWRSGSPIPASSAGSCTTRSRCRTICSTG